MTVEEIKQAITGLSPADQRRITAFLYDLRRRLDPNYQALINTPSTNLDPSKWLTLEEFDRRLDQK